MVHARVLIIDDEPSIRAILKRFLEAKGCAIEEASGSAEALKQFRMTPPDVVLCDYELKDGTGLDLLKQFKGLEPQTPVVILTGQGTIELAVRAIKEGAEHFLTKPLDLPALGVLVERALEQRRRERRQTAGEAIQSRGAPDPFLGATTVIQELARQVRRVATSDSTVLLQGETGSGKGVIARWLHDNGPRSAEAFVDLNCASLGGELLESELFGFAKGAFTSAVTAKQGLLEVAHQGTLFLDEIADMDVRIQPKLLKVLEDQRFRRLGEVSERVVDVRLIAATHQDLAALVEAKSFRPDLYYRVNTIPIEVPPLRRRVDDIPILAAEILRRLSAELGKPGIAISDAATRALQVYTWPGNIRELRNVLERAALVSDAPTIEPTDLRLPSHGDAQVADTTGLTLQEVERRHILHTLREVRGRVPEAAVRLGVPRSSLYEKLKRLDIDPSEV